MQEQITRLSRARPFHRVESGNFCESAPRAYMANTINLLQAHINYVQSHTNYILARFTFSLRRGAGVPAAPPGPFSSAMQSAANDSRAKIARRGRLVGFAWHLLSIRPLIRHFDTHLWAS